MAAADAVDLPRLGVAHGREDQGVSCGGLGGQVLRMEEGGLRGAAAHPGAGQRDEVDMQSVGFGRHAASVVAPGCGRVEFDRRCVLICLSTWG
jgi:hypothetical protein